MAEGQSDEATPCIALIEDDHIVRLGLETLLNSIGMRVEAGVNGQEVAQRVLEAKCIPTAIVADWRLGSTTAKDEVPKVLEVAPNTVLVVITTGDTSPEVRKQVEELGWRLLIKPYHPRELRALLQNP